MGDRVDHTTGVHTGTVTTITSATRAAVEVAYLAPGHAFPAWVPPHVTGLTAGDTVTIAITPAQTVILARVPTT